MLRLKVALKCTKIISRHTVFNAVSVEASMEANFSVDILINEELPTTHLCFILKSKLEAFRQERQE